MLKWGTLMESFFFSLVGLFANTVGSANGRGQLESCTQRWIWFMVATQSLIKIIIEFWDARRSRSGGTREGCFAGWLNNNNLSHAIS